MNVGPWINVGVGIFCKMNEVWPKINLENWKISFAHGKNSNSITVWSTFIPDYRVLVCACKSLECKKVPSFLPEGCRFICCPNKDTQEN